MCFEKLVRFHDNTYLCWLGCHSFYRAEVCRFVWTEASFLDQYGRIAYRDNRDDHHYHILGDVRLFVLHRCVLVGSLVRQLRLSHGVPDREVYQENWAVSQRECSIAVRGRCPNIPILDKINCGALIHRCAYHSYYIDPHGLSAARVSEVAREPGAR